MSLVIAIKTKDNVLMSADSRVSQGENLKCIQSMDEAKVVKTGDVYIGGVGTVSEIQIMKSHHEWFRLNGKPLTKKFLVKNVIPAYYDELKRLGKFKSKDDSMDDPSCGSRFLITDGKRLFLIFRDFFVMEVEKNSVIGCGSCFSEPLLDKLLCKMGENEAMLEVLRRCSIHYTSIAPPYIFINTKEGLFERVEK